MITVKLTKVILDGFRQHLNSKQTASSSVLTLIANSKENPAVTESTNIHLQIQYRTNIILMKLPVQCHIWMPEK